MWIELKMQKVKWDGSPRENTELATRDIQSVVRERCDGESFRDGSLERVVERLKNTQAFLGELVNILAVKNILKEEDIRDLLDGMGEKVIAVIKKED